VLVGIGTGVGEGGGARLGVSVGAGPAMGVGGGSPLGMTPDIHRNPKTRTVAIAALIPNQIIRAIPSGVDDGCCDGCCNNPLEPIKRITVPTASSAGASGTPLSKVCEDT